jgi:hypothetical protein
MTETPRPAADRLADLRAHHMLAAKRAAGHLNKVLWQPLRDLEDGRVPEYQRGVVGAAVEFDKALAVLGAVDETARICGGAQYGEEKPSA